MKGDPREHLYLDGCTRKCSESEDGAGPDAGELNDGWKSDGLVGHPGVRSGCQRDEQQQVAVVLPAPLVGVAKIVERSPDAGDGDRQELHNCGVSGRESSKGNADAGNELVSKYGVAEHLPIMRIDVRVEQERGETAYRYGQASEGNRAVLFVCKGPQKKHEDDRNEEMGFYGARPHAQACP